MSLFLSLSSVFLYLSVSPYLPLCLYLCVCLSLCLSLPLSLSSLLPVSLYQSVSLSLSLSICPSLCLLSSLSACLSLCQSVSLFLSLEHLHYHQTPSPHCPSDPVPSSIDPGLKFLGDCAHLWQTCSEGSYVLWTKPPTSVSSTSTKGGAVFFKGWTLGFEPGSATHCSLTLGKLCLGNELPVTRHNQAEKHHWRCLSSVYYMPSIV